MPSAEIKWWYYKILNILTGIWSCFTLWVWVARIPNDKLNEWFLLVAAIAQNIAFMDFKAIYTIAMALITKNPAIMKGYEDVSDGR